MTRFQSLVILMLIASAESLEWIKNDNYTEFTRYVAYKDDNGHTKYLDLTTESDPIFEYRRADFVRVQFILYTRNNPISAQLLKANAPSSIKSSYLNPDVPTVMIAHGWLGDGDSEINTVIKKALLRKSDVNVIVIDWHHIALGGYIAATMDVPRVGKKLGGFLVVLNSTTGVRFDSIHLIGHSLGAHVVGNAGRKVGGKVARITGLDPAGPLWGMNRNRLRSTDAVYVEVIHTNGGVLGMSSPIGDIDFYPNGGFSQPGCSTDICSHTRSWQLFASSLTYNKLTGYKCNCTKSSNKDRLPMGNNDLKKIGLGIYCLKTTKSYPYFL